MRRGGGRPGRPAAACTAPPPLGYVGNLFNSNVGLGLRIAALRRSAPDHSPPPSVLIAAELPIVVIEIALAACSPSR